MKHNIDTTEGQAFYLLFLNILSLSHVTVDEERTLCGKEPSLLWSNQDYVRIYSTAGVGCSVCRKAMLKRLQAQKLNSDTSAKVL